MPGKKEVLICFFHGKFNQRGKTRIFVDESNWDRERQCNKIPRVRVMSEKRTQSKIVWEELKPIARE